jgi:hypothetical protein
MSQWTDPTILASCISAAAALTAAGAAVWYAIITRGLLRATAENTAVTRAIFEAAQRPYVGVEELRLNSKDATSGSLFAKLKNHGSVPAHKANVKLRVDLDGTIISDKSIEQGIALFPGDNIHVHVPLQNELLAAFTTTFSDSLCVERINVTVSVEYSGPGGHRYEVMTQHHMTKKDRVFLLDQSSLT